MSCREIAHILTITPDPEHDEDWDWNITCPYEPDGFDKPGCPCSTLMECDCKLSDEEADDVHSCGEGPCPKSPTGFHKPLPFGFGHPINSCWAKECDYTCDVASDMHSEHGLGVYVVALVGGWDELELEVLARVDEAVTA